VSIQPHTGRPGYDLGGRVALIAGGSRGIGADTARAFAAAGASVVIGARDAERLQALAAEITAAGGAAIGVRTDVTDPDACRGLVQAALDSYGRLDFAFNNATDGHPPQPLAEIAVEDFDRGIAANIRGTFLGMKYQIPAMLASGGGAVVNMASVAGLSATANLATYVTGKAGIIAMTRVAALDYADQGVRVNVVAPGPIRTYHIEQAGERAMQLAAESVPMRRMGLTEDVSDVVLWLCSPGAAYVTGAVIPIDGGQTAGFKPRQMYAAGKPMD
jgi:NAD(P)-dependent dehydrogenase (short-subunit alcohol dehydrogenase family)